MLAVNFIINIIHCFRVISSSLWIFSITYILMCGIVNSSSSKLHGNTGPLQCSLLLLFWIKPLLWWGWRSSFVWTLIHRAQTLTTIKPNHVGRSSFPGHCFISNPVRTAEPQWWLWICIIKNLSRLFFCYLRFCMTREAYIKCSVLFYM